MKRLTLIFALCLLTHPAFADLFDGNGLYRFFQMCEKYKNGDKSIENYWNCGISKGYVAGVHDTLLGQAFCTPANTALGEVEDVVRIWLDKHPAERSYSTESLVIAALQEAWPCPED